MDGGVARGCRLAMSVVREGERHRECVGGHAREGVRRDDGCVDALEVDTRESEDALVGGA